MLNFEKRLRVGVGKGNWEKKKRKKGEPGKYGVMKATGKDDMKPLRSNR